MATKDMFETPEGAIALMRAIRALDQLYELMEDADAEDTSIGVLTCATTMMLEEVADSDLTHQMRADIITRLELEERTVDAILPAWPPQPPADVSVVNHGSMITFTPKTDAAREWIKEHTSEDAPTFGGALMVEPRYADDLQAGMEGDGLVVQ